jgi:hypothetical protein
MAGTTATLRNVAAHAVRFVPREDKTDCHRTKRGIMRVIFEHLRPPGRITTVRCGTNGQQAK